MPARTVAHKTDHRDQTIALEKMKAIPFNFDSLRTGDIILRTGNSFFSDELRKFSLREAKYSHCGWISRERDGKLFIYHAIGGTDNPDNRLRKDKLALFLHPYDVKGFGIFRYEMGEEQIAAADQSARKLFADEVRFDLKFDIEDEEELYCAEFIYKIVTDATSDKNFISLSHIKNKAYVAIDDLYLNPNCKKIFEHEYK